MSEMLQRIEDRFGVRHSNLQNLRGFMECV